MALMKTSYELSSATNQVMHQGGLFGGCEVITDGTNNAAINVYDIESGGSPASGNKIYETTVIGSDNYGGIIYPHPIICRNGLYVTISGTGATCIVFYKPGKF